ncbi:MAG: helix-turn-helix domain-containing protein [Bradyrhizobium sp.]
MADAKARARPTPGQSSRKRRPTRESGPNPIDVHVGGRLKQARMIAGMSQEELGLGIGVSFQAVQKYEHGENRLSASRLFQAAKLLGRPVSFFFDELQTTAPDKDVTTLSRDEINLLRDFRRIASENVRDHLLQVAKGVADSGPSARPGRGIRNSS